MFNKIDLELENEKLKIKLSDETKLRLHYENIVDSLNQNIYDLNVEHTKLVDEYEELKAKFEEEKKDNDYDYLSIEDALRFLALGDSYIQSVIQTFLNDEFGYLEEYTDFRVQINEYRELEITIKDEDCDEIGFFVVDGCETPKELCDVAKSELINKNIVDAKEIIKNKLEEYLESDFFEVMFKKKLFGVCLTFENEDGEINDFNIAFTDKYEKDYYKALLDIDNLIAYLDKVNIKQTEIDVKNNK